MTLANAVYTDAVSLVMLTFVLASSLRHSLNTPTQRRLFLWIVLSSMAELALDAFGRAFDAMPGLLFFYLNLLSNVLLFTFIPIVSCLWVLYADYQVWHDEKRLRTYLWPLAAYLLLNAALSAASVFTGWYFSVSPDNVYARGPFYLVYAAPVYATLLYPVFFILANRRRIDRRHFAALLLFPLPPAVGSALQNVFYGMSLTGAGVALSVLMIFINLQNKQLHTDYLTGIYNRRLLDDFVREKFKAGARGEPFSAILLDLDGFKKINDRFGHDAGDAALTDAADLLKSCMRQSDFISRYGGDEFLVISEISDRNILEGTVERVRRCFKSFNEKHIRQYELSFSAGYDVYNAAAGMGPEQFFKHIDRLMYEAKRKAGER